MNKTLNKLTYNSKLIALILQGIICLICMQWVNSFIAWILLGYTIGTTGLSFLK